MTRPADERVVDMIAKLRAERDEARADADALAEMARCHDCPEEQCRRTLVDHDALVAKR